MEVDLSEMEQEQMVEQPRPVTQPTPRKPEPDPKPEQAEKPVPQVETKREAANNDGLDDDQFSQKTVTRSEFEDIKQIALQRLSQQDRVNLAKLMHGADITIWQLAIAQILSGTRPQYLAEQASFKQELTALQSVIAGAEKSADKNFETSKANIANFAAVAQKIQQANSEFYENYMLESTKRIETSTRQLHAKIINHYKGEVSEEISKRVTMKLEQMEANSAEKAKGMLMWVVLSVLAGSMVSGLIGFLIGKLV